MEHISKHLHNAGRSTTIQQPGANSSSINQDTIRLINQIFSELRAMRPAWKQAFSSTREQDETKTQWLKAFMAEGISDYSTIDAGLDACRRAGVDFIPSPGKFIGYCRQALYGKLGALDPMEAYRKLQGYYCRPKDHQDLADLNPFISHTISEGFDAFNFQRMADKDAKAYFVERYSAALAGIAAGDELRKPVAKDLRINNPSGCTHSAGRVSKEQGHANIAEMLESLRS